MSWFYCLSTKVAMNGLTDWSSTEKGAGGYIRITNRASIARRSDDLVDRWEAIMLSEESPLLSLAIELSRGTFAQSRPDSWFAWRAKIAARRLNLRRRIWLSDPSLRSASFRVLDATKRRSSTLINLYGNNLLLLAISRSSNNSNCSLLSP